MPINWIVINGMRNSGRRYAANFIRRSLVASMAGVMLETGHNRTRGFDEEALVISDSFNAPVKHLVATLLGVTYLETDRYRPRPELNGYNIDMFRDQMILYMRENFGEDVFGRCLVHRVLRNKVAPRFVIIDDGNTHDVTALTKPFVIRLTRMDKRFTVQETNFIPVPAVCIENNDHAGTFQRALSNIVSQIIQERMNGN